MSIRRLLCGTCTIAPAVPYSSDMVHFEEHTVYRVYVWISTE